MSLNRHHELVERLRFTFMAADYLEIDELLAGLRKKSNYEALCEEFFHGCSVDASGFLKPGGFFEDAGKNTPLMYAMYQILGKAPDSFILKHRVSKAKLICHDTLSHFRIPEYLFLLPSLEILSIRGMGISHIPESIAKSSNLKILDLSRNKLTQFPSSILSLSRLSALNLSFNLIEEVPEKISRLRKIRILSLRGNCIKHLPETWHRFQFLSKLDLSMNRLCSVPKQLEMLMELNDFNVSYNDMPASEEASLERRFNGGLHCKGAQGMLEIGS